MSTIDPPDSIPGSDTLIAQNQALRQELGVMKKFIDSLQHLMETMNTPHDESEIMELLDSIVDSACSTLQADDGSLLVLDDDTGELVFIIATGRASQAALRWRRLPRGHGIAGWVADNRRPTIVNDPNMDQRFFSDFDRELSFSTRTLVAAPIIGGGRVLGVLEILNKQDGHLFNTADQTLLTILCRFAGELLSDLMLRSETTKLRG